MYPATIEAIGERRHASEATQRWSAALPLAATTFAFVSSYFELFIFPNVAMAPWGDQVLFLENGRRILNWCLPYRDYLQFLTPGADLFYAVLLHIWGVRAWIPNLTMAVLAAIIVLLATLVSRRFFSGPALLIPALLVTGFVLPSSLYATHHWFSTASILGAVLALIDDVTMRRSIIAGLLCGIAVDFTQSAGTAALLGFTIFLLLQIARSNGWREFSKCCAALWLAAVAVFLAVNGYFIWISGIARFAACTIIFPIRYYGVSYYNTWRVYLSQFSLHMGVARLVGFAFVHVLVPFVYIAWFWSRRRRPLDDVNQRRAELLIALAGLALFASVAGAPSFLRLCAVAPPAVILFAVMLREMRSARWLLNFAITGLALLLSLAAPVRTQQHLRGTVKTPSGRVAFLDADRLNEFRWVADHTTEGQTFFGHPPICFTLKFNNPTPVNFITASEYTRPSEVAAILRGLEETRTPMVLLPADDDPVEKSPPHQAILFREYLASHYSLVRRFPTGDAAWLRNVTGSNVRLAGASSGNSPLAPHD